MPIPLYSFDFDLIDYINPKRAIRLENSGHAKLVRHKGHLNRAVMYRRPGDPHPTTIRQYMGTGYSFEQPLSDGHHCWKLRPLQGGHAESLLAPAEVRPIFLRVLLDCMAPAA
jgi:hypothetical protein